MWQWHGKYKLETRCLIISLSVTRISPTCFSPSSPKAHSLSYSPRDSIIGGLFRTVSGPMYSVQCTVYSVHQRHIILLLGGLALVDWLISSWSNLSDIESRRAPVTQSPSRPVTQSNWRRISYNTVRLRWERKLIDLDPVAAGTIHPRRDRKIVWRIEKENAKEAEEAKDVNARRPKTSQGGKHTMGRIFQWPIVVSWVGRWVGEKGVGLVGFILLIE